MDIKRKFLSPEKREREQVFTERFTRVPQVSHVSIVYFHQQMAALWALLGGGGGGGGFLFKIVTDTCYAMHVKINKTFRVDGNVGM